jgi:glycerol-3-phosphate dehydrogenase subunit B
VTNLIVESGRVLGATAETSALRPRDIHADAVILATGGLYASGLESDYHGHIIERIVGLPIANVHPLTEWFDQPFTSGAAQQIHRVGVTTDADLRPLRSDGIPFASNLFACGRILAGYSPVADGCTEGVDLATGVLAGRNAVHLLMEAN